LQFDICIKVSLDINVYSELCILPGMPVFKKTAHVGLELQV